MTLDDTAKQHLIRLIDALRIAIPRTFDSMSNEYPDLCGFAIGTTVYIEFVVPICQSSNELPDGVRSCWERFSPPEWEMMNDRERNDSFGDEVDEARKTLYEHCSATDDDTSYEIRMAYLDSLLSLFVELEAEGKFGSKTDERFLTMWLADDDEGEWIVKSSEKLNTSTTHQQVMDEIG